MRRLLDRFTPGERPARGGAARGFAVVELFTSEGCSSCPPADEVFGGLANGHDNVFLLGFHVDYWDRLGWPDRFATADATARQHRYAGAAGSNRVYTPQMIVNGRREFVGSNRREAAAAVGEAVLGSSAIDLVLDRTDSAVRVQHPELPPGLTVNVALIEPTAHTEVERGENGGRHLVHHHIVRCLSTVPPTGTATHIGALAGGAALEVVAFLQDARTMEIVAATNLS